MPNEDSSEGLRGPKKPQIKLAQPVAEKKVMAAKSPRRLIGLGASAGGLNPLQELIGCLMKGDFAVIVVQHLAPEHSSALSAILARNSRLEVMDALDGAHLQANTIYVLPPNMDIRIQGGILALSPRDKKARHLDQIDIFFKSLAQSHGPLAIGVVLSGTGTDGTAGLRAIKEGGGITYAQDPTTALYSGMPISAIDSGCVDVSLAPKAIAKQLSRFSAEADPDPVRATKAATFTGTTPHLDDLFRLIRARFRVNLGDYKMATLQRRIERRMALHRFDNLGAYLEHVKTDPQEIGNLYHDLLIHVTSFFRDPESFTAMQDQIFAPLLATNIDPECPLRIWVVGCSTGQEAYSVAMNLVEFLEETGSKKTVQIFATDLSERSLKVARRGRYPVSIEDELTLARRRRFFVAHGETLQVSRQLRDMVIFSRQDLIQDAPFSRIDLVLCRNVLIYLNNEAQHHAMRVMHYALRPNGVLMLGRTETLGEERKYYSVADKKNRFYKKNGLKMEPPQGRSSSVLVTEALGLRSPPPASVPNFQVAVERKLLEHFAPPGVIINQSLEVLQFRGPVGPYLAPTPGKASFNLLRLVRSDLHAVLKSRIRAAKELGKAVRGEVQFMEGDAIRNIILDVIPLLDPETSESCCIVLFSEPGGTGQEGRSANQADRHKPKKQVKKDSVSVHSAEIQRELDLTKEHLKIIVEDKNSSNVDLKTSNEELQSSNEELQSTNEELETSKEEMQSANEELTTVNEELQNRMNELGLLNDDMTNLLGLAQDPIVIVDMSLRIRRFTAAAAVLLNLIPADVGRDVRAVERFLSRQDTLARVTEVINSLSMHEEEVLASNGHWYRLRIVPYKTREHVIRGAILMLRCIDLERATKTFMGNIDKEMDFFFSGIDSPLALLNQDLVLISPNGPFRKLFGLEAKTAAMLRVTDLHGGSFVDDNLRAMIKDTFVTDVGFSNYMRAYVPDKAAGRAVNLKVNGSRLPWPPVTKLILLSVCEVACA